MVREEASWVSGQGKKRESVDKEGEKEAGRSRVAKS
jgi:hypothetical protein